MTAVRNDLDWLAVEARIEFKSYCWHTMPTLDWVPNINRMNYQKEKVIQFWVC